MFIIIIIYFVLKFVGNPIKHFHSVLVNDIHFYDIIIIIFIIYGSVIFEFCEFYSQHTTKNLLLFKISK